VLALWWDAQKQVITGYGDLMDGKVVADPSNSWTPARHAPPSRPRDMP
jgi:predicted dinucleotide-binding enzyme